MVSIKYKNHEDFFRKCGAEWLQPVSGGECFFPVTVEEMFQHFKSRLIKELCVTTSELLNPASLEDRSEDVPNVKLRGAAQ